MGNQQGKSGGAGSTDEDDYVKYDPSTVGTRETLAAWHRYGISIWDVYDVVEELGQGHMGKVYKVRRKARSAHTQVTRKVSADTTNSDATGTDEASTASAPKESKPPAASKKPKGLMSALKKIPKHLKGAPGTKGVSKKGEENDVEDNLDFEANHISEPPKALPSTATPKSILRKSHYANPRVEVKHEEGADDDDDDDDHGVDESQWKSLKSSVAEMGDRQEHIAEHRATMLERGQHGDAKGSVRSVNSAGSTDSGQKIKISRDYACKVLSTSRIKDRKMDEMMNEIYIMRSLDHPYILKLYEIYQVKRKIWLVMELCTGGDLASKKLIEPEVVVVAEQILRALSYMHRRGIVHRDLKLENVLFETRKSSASIRLIDFGLSKTYDRAEVSRKAIGTSYTLSPEIASKTGSYTDKTDMWSLGCMLFILLSGEFPFIREDADLDDKFKLNRLINAQYRFGITWRGRGISQNAKYFVEKCLKKDPKDRWTSREALDYVEAKWIPAVKKAWEDTENPVKDEALNRAITTRREQADMVHLPTEDMQRFCGYGRLKKTILMTMAVNMDRNDVGRLNEQFLMADTEDTGTLNLLELKNALHKVNPDMSDETIETIFKGIDQDHSGEIHYNEFLAALAESQGLVTQERLAEAFDRIDAEGKGYISHDDLKMVLGKDYDHAVVNEMMNEADFDKKGQIDYDKLLQLMFEDPTAAMDTVGDVTESLRGLEGFQDIVTDKFQVGGAK